MHACLDREKYPMTICQVCQKENPAGAEYCEDCGAALSVAAPTPVGAGVTGGGSAAASATGTGPTASSAGSVGSLAPEGPETRGDASAPPAAEAAPTPASPASPEAPTVPPISSSSSAAASPAAPSGSGTSGPSAPSTDTSQAQARLVAVRYGASTGEEVPLFGQRLVVGRFDPETGPVDIDLSEAAESGHISRQHGELYREANGPWMVRDLGSTNGVFVKGGDTASFGPRITAPRALNDGDEVAFGNARFMFKTT
jgi:hypothetical protein